MKFWVLISVLILIPLAVKGQETVSLSGIVKNELTLQPAAGVVVKISNTLHSYQSVTNINGHFKYEDVKFGRYILNTQSIEFDLFTQELLVTRGGIKGLQISLNPSVVELDSVTVKASPTRIKSLNINEVSIEQTLRFPATFFDPSRAIICSTPGVMIQNDQNNNIIVNGKSPNYIKWMVEGANIVNPNHLSNAGTLSDRPIQSGGGVNLFSAQMLGSTQFLQPPYTSYYGNASSGILQMNLREGSNNERLVAQASLLGMDVAMEGPIGNRTTFLANGRYSTIGILGGLGLDFGDESINFYDGAFTVNHTLDNGGSIKMFGFGGFSRNQFDAPERSEWEEDKDSTNIDFDNEVLGIGARLDLPITKGKLSITAIYSTLNSNRMVAGICGDNCEFGAALYDFDDKLLSGRIHLERELRHNITLHAGVIADYKDQSIESGEVTGISQLYLLWISGADDYGVINPYLAFNWSTYKFNLETGLRLNYSTFYDDVYYEPRFGLDYFLSQTSTLSLGYDYGIQYLPIDALFSVTAQFDLKQSDPINVHNFTLGTSHSFGRIRLINYFFLSQFGSVPLYGSVSEFNRLNEFIRSGVLTTGEAKSYGYNVALKRPFVNDFYFIASGAIFKSVTSDNDPSRYDAGYTLSFTTGKEYNQEGRNKKKAFAWNSRVLYSGGLKEENFDLERTIGFRSSTMFDHDGGFVNQLNDYFRLDLRLSWRKEKANSTRTIAIDVQNLFSMDNDAYSRYDFRKGQVVAEKQLGIIPILVYRLEF